MILFIIKSNWPTFLNSKESRDGNVLRFILQLECNISLVIRLSLVMRKPAFCICKNKAVDQLCSNCAADQHLFFATWTVQSLFYLYPKFQASSHL